MGFYEEVHGGEYSSVEEKELLYTVPFFIWANYDIQEEYIELTSLNYLAGKTLELSGIDLPPYFRFISDLNEQVIAINSQGYYLEDDESLHNQNNDTEELLIDYENLQYNNLFDTKNRSEVFFQH